MSVYNLLCTFSKKRSTFAPKFKISIKKMERPIQLYILCGCLAAGAVWFLWCCWRIIQKGKNEK